MMTTMNTGAASLSDEMERAYQRRHALIVTDREDFEAGYRAAIAAGGAQEPSATLVKCRDMKGAEWFDIKVHDRSLPDGAKLYAAPIPRVAATAEPTQRYIVIAYGETDHPQAAFVNEREQLLDAVLGMMYTKPADADAEIREAYAKDLADDDEWSNDGIWSTEFEIGGIVIYDLGYGSAASNGEQA